MSNIHRRLAADYSELARQEACNYIAYKTFPRQVFAVKSRRKLNRLCTKAKLRVIAYAEQVEHHLLAESKDMSHGKPRRSVEQYLDDLFGS